MISSRLARRVESLPGWFLPRERIVGSCEAERIREVTLQDLERRRGVRSCATLPWPPRRRMLGGAIVGKSVVVLGV